MKALLKVRGAFLLLCCCCCCCWRWPWGQVSAGFELQTPCGRERGQHRGVQGGPGSSRGMSLQRLLPAGARSLKRRKGAGLAFGLAEAPFSRLSSPACFLHVLTRCFGSGTGFGGGDLNENSASRRGDATERRESSPSNKKPKVAGPSSAPPPPTKDRSNLLVVGLGNPGKEYEMTRHNLGFLVADELSRRWSADLRPNKRFLGEYGSARLGPKSVGVLKPATFMNLSGQSVRAALDFFKVPRSNVLVLVDEIALDYGAMRLRLRGSPGGHNGLKSVESYLKGKDYHRLRLGVGAPAIGEDLPRHVLGKWSRKERDELDYFISAAADAVEQWVREDDLNKVMSKVNSS